MARQVTTPNVPPADAAGVDDDVTLDSPTGAHTTQLNELAARGFTRVNDPRQVAPADAAREVKPADAGLLRFLADDIAHTFQCASQDDACICGAEHHAARLRALARELETKEQRRSEFFDAFTARPCTRCGGTRNWRLDGQLQAVCHNCAYPPDAPAVDPPGAGGPVSAMKCREETCDKAAECKVSGPHGVVDYCTEHADVYQHLMRFLAVQTLRLPVDAVIVER